jgi:regulatory protein
MAAPFRGSEDTESRGSAAAGQALQVAYRYLNRRERTVAEMRARLEREQDIPEATRDVAIAELLDYGYLDDARYARVFAQDRRNLDQWGTDRITRTLRERGIDRDLITAALSQIADAEEGTELDRAVALLHQRFPAGPTSPRDRDRAFGVLIRKGYESELSADAVSSWARGLV